MRLLRTAAASEVSDSRASTAAARSSADSSASFRAACTIKFDVNTEGKWHEPALQRAGAVYLPAAHSDCLALVVMSTIAMLIDPLQIGCSLTMERTRVCFC